MDVSQLISDAQAYAQSTFDSASSNIDSATAAITGIAGLQVSYELPFIAEPTPFTPAPAPTLVATNFVMPSEPPAPEAPELIPNPIDGLNALPILENKKPSIDIDKIVKPLPLQAFNQTAPSINTSFSFPSPPSMMEPSAPSIADRAAPAKPAILLPRFDALRPADIAGPPTDYAEKFTAAYRQAAPSMVSALEGQIDAMLAKYNPQYSAQMARIEDKLTSYMAGGTALTPATEDAIYERTKDKVHAETRRAQEAAYMDAAKRGFTMPSGALMSAVRQARQAGADNNARAAVDIAVKMAEMEQQNMQFAVTTSTTLRTTMLSAALSYHQNLISLNGQALDYAKSIMSAMIELYNTLVREYSARLEGYKAEASVFETRLRGAMADIELYKAEIDALQALTQVDVAKVSVYRERIGAMTAIVNMYRTRVEAVVSQASLEKLKLEMFSEQVRAYTAQTQAKSAEWQGYSAAVSGEEAKARVYGSQVQAYQAEWSGYNAQVQAKSEQVRAVAISNQAKATYAAAQVQSFSALVGAESSRVQAEISFQGQLLQQYGVANQAAVAAASAATEAYKAKGDIAISAGKLAVESLLQSAQLDLGRTKAIADTALATGTVYGNLSAAALSGMNTLVMQSA